LQVDPIEAVSNMTVSALARVEYNVSKAAQRTRSMSVEWIESFMSLGILVLFIIYLLFTLFVFLN